MMTALLVSLVAVGIFALGLYFARIGDLARNVLQDTYQGVAAMTDASLTDEHKEVAVRRAGIAVLLGACSMSWRFALCCAMTYLPICLAHRLHIANGDEIIKLMLRPDYMIFVSVVLIAGVWLVNQRRHASGRGRNALSYSIGERIIHMIAFASPALQRLAARVDDVAFRLLHRDIGCEPPIFITSLARGGTTALLNAFSELPSVATHTYRDMPFITAPYLWNRLSAPFKGTVVRQERAHGDGLEIVLDSPEAFEEVYWKLYWPEKYDENRLIMWQADDLKAEAISYLRACFPKIAHLRQRPGARYLSKNNANIARLRMIRQAFPGAQVVVPVRRPAPQAASLLRQYRNFLERQSKDDFVRRYMRDIGHLEFGVLHTPIAFDEFDSTAYNPSTPDYWLAYWICAFREVFANIGFCHVVLQDDLRSNADSCMRHLLAELRIDAGDRSFAGHFRREADVTDRSVFSPCLLAAADSLYAEISERALS